MRAFWSRGIDKVNFRADIRYRYNHASLRRLRQVGDPARSAGIVQRGVDVCER